MTTSSAVLTDGGDADVMGLPHTVGHRISREVPSFQPVWLEGLKGKVGKQGRSTYTLTADVSFSGSSETTVIQANVVEPLGAWVKRVREAAVALIGVEAEFIVATKHWEDGSPYLALVAEAPVESVAAAMTIEETLLDWVIDNVPSVVRASLVVSVRRSR